MKRLSQSPEFWLNLAICTIALIALMWETALSYDAEDGLRGTIWRMLRFYTILTNLVIAVFFAARLVFTFRVDQQFAGAVTVSIIIVALIYHLLLSRGYGPGNLAFYPDHGLHSVVPFLCCLWWLIYAPKDQLKWADSLVWLIFPGSYLAYVLIRARSDGIYPYHFVDAAELGLGAFAVNILAIAFGFVMVGWALITLSQILKRVVNRH